MQEHLLLIYPALAGARLQLTGSAYVDLSPLQETNLVAGYHGHRGPLSHGSPQEDSGDKQLYTMTRGNQYIAWSLLFVSTSWWLFVQIP